MAQLHFTLDYDFFVGLFSESKDEAFGKLMEAILNQVLQAESAEQLGAENYERSSARSDYRNGTRTRSLTTRIGKIELKVPRHRNIPFRTMLFENYQRNEQALIATMMEMVVQGVSTRNVQKVTTELCGETFSKSAVSEICKELDVPIKQFKERLLPERYSFIITDAIYLKVREDHRVRSKALYIAIGINNSGHKEVIGFEVYDSERKGTWKEFFENLKSRGLRGVDFVISDAQEGHGRQVLHADLPPQAGLRGGRRPLRREVPRRRRENDWRPDYGEALRAPPARRLIGSMRQHRVPDPVRKGGRRTARRPFCRAVAERYGNRPDDVVYYLRNEEQCPWLLLYVVLCVRRNAGRCFFVNRFHDSRT